MSASLLFPWALALLPFGIVFWLWQARSLANLSPKRRRISTLVRTILFVLLVLALSDPRILLERNNHHVVILADVSSSVDKEALERAAELYQFPGDTSRSLIYFAGRTETVSPGDDGNLPPPGPLEPEQSRITEALRFAAASVPAGSAPTVLLVSDGRETGGDLTRAAEALRASGVRVHAEPVEPPDRPEILIRKIEAPREALPGEPFPVEVEVTASTPGSGVLEIFRNGALSGSREVDLRAGSNRFAFTERASNEGVVQISASIRPDEGLDTFVDNNRLTAHVRTGKKSGILYLSDQPDTARFIARALSQEGFRLDIRPGSGIPQSMAELEEFDLVVFDNIPATDLSRRQMTLLRDYVRDFGGGFLMLGGENSFGLGGYFNTPVDAMLPVESDFKKDEETPSLAVVLVIDRSGSMTGQKIEMVKAASEATVELLSVRDYAGVIAFDSQAYAVSKLQSAANQAQIIRQIRRLSAGGGTNISPGLTQAHVDLSGNPAKIKHVILLTDGRSTPGPFYDIVSRMARDGITVSTVAVGDGADRALLEQIAEWGDGRFYFTADPSKVVQIFARETVTASRSAIQELPFLPIRLKTVDFLKKIDFSNAPFLLGFVSTLPKATADLWLATETGEPLLATWRYGLGKAGAFTSDARNRWATDWLRWPSFGRFWAGIFRHLLREPDLGSMPVRFEQRGDQLHLQVEAVDSSGEYIPGAEGSLKLRMPDGEAREVALAETAPGTLKGSWPAAAGTHYARLLLRSEGEVFASKTAIHDVGYSEEFEPAPADREALARLAETTGGFVKPTIDQITANDRPVRKENELWPWLVLVAAFLFPLDVALKRWPSSISRG